MKYLATLIILFTTLITSAQPNKNKVDSVLLSGDTLYQFINGTKSVRGIVIQSGATQTLNYLPEKGNYISKTSGNALQQLGYWNLAIGDNAFDSSNSTSTSYNICFGKDAGRSLNGGQDNFFAGWDAGYHTRGGSANIGIVEDALFSNIGGRDNIALGRGAQYSHQFPVNNVNIGYNTSYYQITGTENTGVGAYALGFMEGGYGVTALGAYAGEMNASGAGKTIFNSIYIGYCAGLNSMFSNSILIGANTEVTGDRQLNIGKTILGTNIGLSNAKITIKGSLEVTTGDITFNGVHYLLPSSYPIGVQSQLVNDGQGNLSWQPISQPIAQKINYQPETFAAYTSTGQLLFLTKIKTTNQ